MHSDDDLIGVVDDGEIGVSGEPQRTMASVFVNDPGGHDRHAAVGSTERSILTNMAANGGVHAWYFTEAKQAPAGHQVSQMTHLSALLTLNTVR